MKKTDYLSDAECRVRLEDLYNGNAVVLPVDIEHAECMIRLASFYIDQEHLQTMKALKADYAT